MKCNCVLELQKANRLLSLHESKICNEGCTVFGVWIASWGPAELFERKTRGCVGSNSRDCAGDNHERTG
jgi:hypothetical protein